MGRRGPKPLPASVIELRGNRSKLTGEELEERRRSEIRPNPVSPRRPSDLSPDERACWDMHAPELDRLGLLTVLDGAAFRLLVCQPYALVMTSFREMMVRKADGTPDRRSKRVAVVVPDSNHGGEKRHPAFVAWSQALNLYRAGCIQFGLTPMARVGLRPAAPIGTVADEDEDEAFFGA